MRPMFALRCVQAPTALTMRHRASAIWKGIRCFSSSSKQAAETLNISQNVLDKVGRNLHLQKHHPINTIKSRIEDYFQRTYKDGSGSSIFQAVDNLHPQVTTTQNFDELLIPSDHVSRRLSDTFYFSESSLLRTHTSAHQTQLMRQGLDAFLCTGDCYRRDEIDSSHYPVFHQMEGVRLFNPVDHGLSSDRKDTVPFVERELKQSLEGMVRHVFGQDLQTRWVDEYFPFTDPSFELEIFFEGDWMEVLGCGMIHQQILHNCGLGDRVGWAFGIGIERLAMVLYNIPDIRLFWSTDPRFLDQFQSEDIVKFKPFSKYPPVYKDVSFWVKDSSFHENDFFEVVREYAGDMAEKVDLIDAFTHPKTGVPSKCFRITYRSMDRNLTNEEIDSLQEDVRANLSKLPGLELR